MEVERYLDKIAGRLREWRREAGMTLQQVANRSGVAASTIQKVEHQQMVPTIAVLFKIARGLDRTPTEMLDEKAEPVVAFRPGRSGATPFDAAVPPVENLTGELADSQLSTWRVRHSPRDGLRAVDLGRRGEALILCEAGQLEVSIGDENHMLAPGDSVHFKTRAGVQWRAHGDVPADFMLIGADTLELAQLAHPELPADAARG
jgi:transcriptional regulator with XRE-family HTH domain